MPNLQLLEGIPNQEKSDSDFGDWLKSMFHSEQERANYMAKNYIPAVDLSVPHFREFATERRNLIKSQFAALLGVRTSDEVLG